MKKSNQPTPPLAPIAPKQPVKHILNPVTKQPVDNPELNAAAKKLRQENNPQNLNAVINQLTRAVFLAPAKVEFNGEAPKPDANGRVQMPKDTKVTFSLLKASDGRAFFPAFTNETEMMKWKQTVANQVMALRFDDYARMLQQNDQVAGFVVDPFGDNLRFESKMVAAIKQQHDAAVERAKAGLRLAQVKPGDKITIVEPTVYPDALLDPLCELFAQQTGVAAAYLQIMLVNETDRYYLLVLDAAKDDKLFAAIAQAARPFMSSAENVAKKINLNITTSETPLGQQGMRDSEPFYVRGKGRVNLDEEDD